MTDFPDELKQLYSESSRLPWHEREAYIIEKTLDSPLEEPARSHLGKFLESADVREAQEAMAFDQASQSEMTASSDTSSEANVMRKIMQLVQAYGDFGLTSGQTGSSGTLSTSA